MVFKVSPNQTIPEGEEKSLSRDSEHPEFLGNDHWEVAVIMSLAVF